VIPASIPAPSRSYQPVRSAKPRRHQACLPYCFRITRGNEQQQHPSNDPLHALSGTDSPAEARGIRKATVNYTNLTNCSTAIQTVGEAEKCNRRCTPINADKGERIRRRACPGQKQRPRQHIREQMQDSDNSSACICGSALEAQSVVSQCLNRRNCSKGLRHRSGETTRRGSPSTLAGDPI
jgi:hypothetical protein